MLKNRKTKHTIGDIVFSSGNFYPFSALPMKVTHIEKQLVTAIPLSSIPFREHFTGQHLDFFSIEEILQVKPDLKDEYPDLFNKKIEKQSKVETCCQKYTSKFCPDCGKII